MGGFFGGLLGAVNLLGGVTLYLLMGKVAWKKNELAIWCRTIIGSLVAGGIIGFIVWLTYYLPQQSDAESDPYRKALSEGGYFTFMIIPAMSLAVCMVLQLIKDWLTEDPPEVRPKKQSRGE